MNAPVWIQWIVYAAVVAGAVGGLIKTVVKPSIQRGKNVAKLVDKLVDLPQGVLELSKIAEASKITSEAAKSVADTAAQLAERSIGMIKDQRVAFEKFEKYAHERNWELADTLTKLLLQSHITGKSIALMEENDVKVADDLAKAKEAVEGVASDLEESHKQADAIPHDAPHGAAADAAAKTVNGNGDK